MSSLQEQLLKAGLVDEKKLARASQQKKKQANLERKQRGKKSRHSNASRQPAKNSKAERDRELNRQRQERVRQKELAAQITQLIVDNKLDRSSGEQPYGFVYKRKVKKIYVTEAQKGQLAQGKLSIATHVASDGRRFELVPDSVAQKILERDESCVVSIEAAEDSNPDENDPYAEYRVPDDLTW